MATATASPPVTEDGQVCRVEQRRRLREEQLQKALQELHARHQEERRALSQELRELADGRKVIRDLLWADSIRSSFPDPGPGCHDLTTEQQSNLSVEEIPIGSGSVPKGTQQRQKEILPAENVLHDEAVREGDEISIREGSVLIASHQREKEKQAKLEELLPAKSEVHAELQRLLEVLDEEALRKAYEFRIQVEDPREIRAIQQTLAAKRSGLWRFVSKNKVREQRELVEREGSAKDDIDSVDKQKLGPPHFPESYQEIKKLLDIEKNPIVSATLKESDRKKEVYMHLLQSMRKELPIYRNEVYRLIGFFSVFQGVVLTAVSQSSSLDCHNKWSPIALSVLASVISTLGIILRLKQMNELRTNIELVQPECQSALQKGYLLRKLQEAKPLQKPVSERIDFSELDSEVECYVNKKSKPWTVRQLPCLYYVPVTLTLVVFGVLFPVSFWSILCKPGSPPAQ